METENKKPIASRAWRDYKYSVITSHFPKEDRGWICNELEFPTQQYGLWNGPGPGAEGKILSSGDNLELMQFELGPDEGLANLWKSYRPKIHLLLALVIYSKVTDFTLLTPFQSADWSISPSTHWGFPLQWMEGLCV